jgi:AcrR family transcriptional regulator
MAMKLKEKAASRGRPRSDESRKSILSTALRLCEESGFQNLTVDRLSSEAKVSKQTIYRWWNSLEAVVFEAFREAAIEKISRAGVSRPDSIGLLEFIKTTFREAKKIRSALTKMLGLSQLNETLKKEFYQQFIRERREVASIVVQNQWRGLDPSMVNFAVDTFYGLMWYRLLFEHLPLGDDEAERVFQLLCKTFTQT